MFTGILNKQVVKFLEKRRSSKNVKLGLPRTDK